MKTANPLNLCWRMNNPNLGCKSLVVSLFLGVATLSLGLGNACGEEDVAGEKAVKSVYVIPIEGQINKAQLYILRRGLKQGLVRGIDAVVLKMDTPGGELKVTLDMMEMLDNFKGDTMTYVSNEAISAGAYIAASTDEIYFSPQGILGAAAIVQATGGEIDESMKQKIDSYLRAKVRSMTGEHRYRSRVIRAMMDDAYVLEIDGKVLKEKGELLTLTADEAVVMYGSPPEPLLAAGIAESVDVILEKKYGKGQFHVWEFRLTWSEDLAKWLNAITPILLGLGMLLLFIEFKTPGFGVFGLTGIILLLLVFASSYVAGLAGNEEVLVFVLGLIFVGVELFVFPGIGILAVLGGVMIVGSILWALADIWPVDDFEFTTDIFLIPVIDLTLGMVIAGVGAFILGRFFLKSWFWDNLVLKSTVKGVAKGDAFQEADVGDQGKTVTGLYPTGQVEIKGKRYEARTQVGMIKRDVAIEVVRKEGFALIVKEKQ